MNQQYDPVVENIYLCAVNDQRIHDNCVKLLEREKKYTELVPVNILRGRFRGIKCDDPIHTLSNRQWRLLWIKIKTHLSDYNPCFFPVEHSYMTTTNFFTDDLYNKPLEQSIMNELAKIPLKTITYVFGNDISKADENTLMTLIKRAKNEIRDLEEVEVESTHITAKIAGLNTAITAMVERLDTFKV